MHDLAIVGGGPAGVATAYYLRDLGLDTVILEAGGEVGGRTLTVPVGGVPANTGALFVYRETLAEELAVELGVTTVRFVPETYGIHVGGITVVDTDNDRLIDRLPISPLAREQLREFVRAALLEYGALTEGGQLTDGASELVGQTVADRLAGLDPEVTEIIRRAVQGGSVADPSRLSAQYALRYFASYLAHESENRLYPLDGMQAILERMSAALPEGAIRFHAQVQQITGNHDLSESDCYELVLADGTSIQARDVVLAVPAPIAREITPSLPPWKQEALAVAETPGATTLCVTADATDLPDIVNWAFVAVAGRAFDAIINPVPGDTRTTPDGRRIVQFVCYGNSAGYRPDLMDEAGTDAWVEDFLAVAPELRGRILGAHLQAWEHCFAILTPERIAALPQLQESVGRIHFAGDHTSASAGSHGAYTEARRVAEIIRSVR